MNPFALGAKPRTVDPRHYKLSSFTGSASPTPITFQSLVPIIYMQDKYPTCGGHAPAPLANIIFSTLSSPKYIWDEIKQIDNIPPEDGTTMDAIFQAWKKTGICQLSLLPDDLGKSLADYTNPGNVTNSMITDAFPRKITNYAFTDNPSLQQIKDAIYQYKGVILRVDCGDGWWKNGWSESATCPLKLGTYVDGHFICGTGFDEQYIYFANSWSTAWGRQGIGYFDHTYIPHVREMGVPIVNSITPQPKPTDIPISTPQEPTKYLFTETMNYGDISADVHQLQIRLGVPVSLTFQSGHYGFLTLIAVVKFQITNHLPIMSTVNEKMRTILNA